MALWAFEHAQSNCYFTQHGCELHKAKSSQLQMRVATWFISSFLFLFLKIYRTEVTLEEIAGADVEVLIQMSHLSFLWLHL